MAIDEDATQPGAIPRRTFLGALILAGCGGGGGAPPAEGILLVGDPSQNRQALATLGPAGGVLILTDVAAVTVPVNALAAPADLSVQMTNRPETAAQFQTTASATPVTHRAAGELYVNVGASPPADGPIAVRLTLPEALLTAAPSGIPTVFLRSLVAASDEASDFFDPVEAQIDLPGRSVTVSLWPSDFSNLLTRDGSYEAQLVLASVEPIPASRLPGSRPAETDPDGPCRGWTPVRVSGASFPSMPLSVPLVIVARMGCREATNTPPAGRRPHKGVDLRANGDSVRSVADGSVEILAPNNGLNGNYLRLRHTDGTATEYLHLARFGAGLRQGSAVTAGQEVGISGNTSTVAIEPHLHFQYRNRSGQHLNPEPCLAGASHALPELVSEFLFDLAGWLLVSGARLDKHYPQLWSLRVRARDSVFRDLATPPDADLRLEVTPTSIAEVALEEGFVRIQPSAEGNYGDVTIRVSYHPSVQAPLKAFGQITVHVTDMRGN